MLAISLPAQVSLRDLPAVARARAEHQRPQQEAALKPFWQDLTMEWRENSQYLAPRIAEVAALGDSVVPLLLEKLQPADGKAESRRLAANCRRVLEHLDPSTFVDALLEMLAGKNSTARAEALHLLGLARTERAVQALVEFVATATGDEQLLAIDALAQQRAAAAAPRLVQLLGSTDRQLRESVLDYLIAARAGAVFETVVQALSTENEVRLLPQYVAYFAAAVRQKAAAAEALLPLLDHERLDGGETRQLVKALATVAPKDHEPTQKRLHELIDNGEPSLLTQQAALTLLALGDKSGIEALHKAIAEQMKRPQRRKDPLLFELRGNLYFATEDWKRAADEYKDALDNNPGAASTHRLQWHLVRCEARRHRTSAMLQWFRDMAPSAEEVLEAAKDDPALQEALQQEKARSWLQSLPREQKPANGH